MDFVDCIVVPPLRDGERRRATRSWIGLSTVGTSDPPALRSDTRTVKGALARMQSGVPTKWIQ
jgi:hypothetical protein